VTIGSFASGKILLLQPYQLRAKNNPAMADDNTTQPMLEALLEAQRQFAANLVELRASIASISEKQDSLVAKQDEFAAKQDELAAKQDALDGRVVALTREVRDGFDENNRKIEALNKRLLSFETWLSRIDDRLHDEIVPRTR
jgi:predicted  nucleic acid-binding Zn-ribbon protein